MAKCPECGKNNPDQRYFCGKCGAFLKASVINNKELITLPEIKMTRILENLKEVPHDKIVWDNVVDKYVENVEQYKALYEIDDIKNDYQSGTARKMLDFLDVCRTSEFQIAFVGTIKTGKSTLINALLGKNYASISVTPETAVLTKFRSSEKDYVKVEFYDAEEWEKLWKSMSSGADKFLEEYERLRAKDCKDKWIGHQPVEKYISNSEIEEELKPWTSSQYPEHYFVKEVEVGISNLPRDFPSQVVFVDTPGLSDPVGYRSKIANAYIRRANAVFVCVEAQKLQQEEMETIFSVFSFSSHNKQKVHIIATHWDTLNNPEKDWETQREYMCGQLTGPACYDTRELAEANITYSSAYIHNLCRDYGQLNDEDRKAAKKSLRKFLDNYEEDPEEHTRKVSDSLDFMTEKANIKFIYEIIRSRLMYNYQKFLAGDLAKQYEGIIFDLKREVRGSRKLKKELLEAAQADIEKRREKVAENQKACEEIRKCQEMLRSYIKNVDAQTQRNLDNILAAMDRKPDPDYVKKGKKLYDGGLMEKFKKFIGT